MDWNRDYYAGKTAAVTGAASGVGLALCELLLEYGAERVTLADFNAQNLERETARLAAAHPNKVASALCNVTDKAQVAQMVARAAEHGGGKLDLLINCAGAGFHGKFLFEPDGVDANSPFRSKVLSDTDWERGFALNFAGPVYGCEAAVPRMIAQGGGQIVNIVSGIAFSPMAYQSLYAASKAALLAYSYAIRNELGGYGVKVCAATPGTTATAIFKAMNKDGAQGAPAEAQPPRESAEKVLRGAAQNRRLTLGDKSDEEGSATCFLPDDAGRVLDGVYLGYARGRREGVISFAHEAPQIEMTELVKAALGILQAPSGTMADYGALIGKYAALRNASGLDSAYYAGKTAVVTGGASGVGFAICKKLLECGAKRVALADHNQDGL